MEHLYIMEIEKLLNTSGRVNSALLRENRFIKKFPAEHNEIIKWADQISISDREFTEKIFHWINKIQDPIVCQNCKSKKPKFLGIQRGYLVYCSSLCSNGSKSVQLLKKDKYIKKYGVDNPSKSEEIKDKIKKSFESRYGGNPFSLDNFKNKIKETCLKKYGSEYSLGRDSSVRKKMYKDRENDFYLKYSHLDILEYENDKNGGCRIKCGDCDEIYYISKWNLYQRSLAKTKICTLCNPMGSDQETEIESFVKSILIEEGVEFLERPRNILRSKKELDFYIPNLRLGIECNGIYWHSSKFKERTYHINKTNEGLEEGIKIIHIMEDEIKNTPKIVRSRLISILNLTSKKIYARKCTIREINSKDSSDFLEINHIQGKCGSSVRIGLFYEDLLISIMTLGKNRRSLGNKNNKDEWELLRFCNILNTSVVGSASKLLSYFIKKYHPIKIVSYCDIRWSPDGGMYRKLGFKFIKNTSPNYWYFKNNSMERKHRFSYRKNLLIMKGEDKNKTESKIMEDKGFLKVYDCGSSKWEMTFTINHKLHK